MKWTHVANSLAVGLVVLAVGCGGGNSATMMGANSVGTGMTGATFMSVTPQGRATGVSPTAPIVFHFGAPMGSGMERHVDLHMRDLTGPTVPMNCGWSPDRATLTCTPQDPLAPHTSYVVHLGGGMMTQAGQAIDYAQYGPMMNGQWITGGMMGSSHAGGAWSMMGTGWRNSNGSYGIAFTFATA